MSTASLLMIHNAWTYAKGNANELRKQADDLDVITQASINAYMMDINITEDELKQLLDNETWLSPQSALDMNFCTSIVNEKDSNKASQSVKKSLSKMILDIQNKNKIKESTEDLGEKNNQENEPQQNNDNKEPEEPKQILMGSFFNALLK